MTRVLLGALLTCLTLASLPVPALAQEARDKPVEIVDATIGFQNHYKVGFFAPVQITLRGGSQSATGRVELIVADSDGVPTRVSSPPDRPVQILPGQETTERLYIKPGRVNGRLSVRFLVDGKVRARRTFQAGMAKEGQFLPYGHESKDELIVTVGPSVGLQAAMEPPGDEQGPKTHVANLSGIEDLPTEWCGYDGVDVLVLSTTQPEIYRPLVSGTARAQALVEWVEQGGKLVLFVGSEAQEILAPGSTLASLAPATFRKMTTLRNTRALEVYCETSHRVERGGADPGIEVARLDDVTGVIEAADGDLPLVVRAARAFGQVAVVTVDFDRPPLRRWAGRSEFLKRLLQRETPDLQEASLPQTGQVATHGYTDLVGQLRAGLDRFADVQVVAFWKVASLVLLYILMIGPVDYLLVKKGLKRMEWTWVTFPTIVILFSVGAYLLAYWVKGDQLRVNQVELVDVDVQSGLVRGTSWTHIFSPRAQTYTLSLSPRLPDHTPPGTAAVLLSWMGLPGAALGGMNSAAANQPLLARSYSFTPARDGLGDVPIQVWSTKSIMGRWTAVAHVGMAAELREGADQMLSGYIENNTDEDLADCRLFYDRWVYLIPSIEAGQRLDIESSQDPRTIKTHLVLGQSPSAGAMNVYGNQTVLYDQQSTDVRRVVDVMMFHKAAGGSRFTKLLNRYQASADLSGHLTLSRAILLVPSDAQGSELMDNGQSMAGPRDKYWTNYRYIFPVQRD